MNPYLRAVVAADVTAEHAPKAVVDSAARLLAAIEARREAHDAWVKAKDRLVTTQGGQADAIAEARVRDRPDPTVVSIEDLQRDVEAKAVERDATAKLAARIEHEHWEVIAEHAAEWDEALDSELGRIAAEVAAHADAVEAALRRFDVLASVHELAKRAHHDVVLRESHRPYRLRNRRFTSTPRDGLAVVRKWLAPPEPKRSPRAQNFGNVMSPAAREFMAREEAR